MKLTVEFPKKPAKYFELFPPFEYLIRKGYQVSWFGDWEYDGKGNYRRRRYNVSTSYKQVKPELQSIQFPLLTP